MTSQHIDLSSGNFAGVSAGTTLVGVFSQLPEGSIKTILLLLAPTTTIAISFFWNSFWDEIKYIVIDFRLRRQILKQHKLVKAYEADPNTSPEILLQAKDTLDKLRKIELLLAERRVVVLSEQRSSV